MIFSYEPFGYEGCLVSVESDLRQGIPAIDIVGISDGVVKELRERCKSAIRNSGLTLWSGRTLISLSPADVKKDGSQHDLAVALSMIEQDALRETLAAEDKKILVMGSLGLRGDVQSGRFVFAACQNALEAGIFECVVPSYCVWEAELAGMTVIHGVENLKDAYKALGGEE